VPPSPQERNDEEEQCSGRRHRAFRRQRDGLISYANVLLAEGYEAALAQHVLWGTLLLFLIIYGPGKLSLDYLQNRSRRSNS
jgi:hypothetical protein